MVFSVGKRGNVSPNAVINGPRTRLGAIVAIGLDSEGNIYVANHDLRDHKQQRVTEYVAGSYGNVAPIAIIAGPKTGLADADYSVFGLAVDSAKNIYLAGGPAPPTGATECWFFRQAPMETSPLGR
jgi:hypothetical protein